MDKGILDLYTDYLLVSTAQSTATGMADMLEGRLSHDKVTRFLSRDDFTSRDVWKLVKPTVQEIEKQPGPSYLILDDTVEGKPSTDKNELICWHFDHTVGKSVKGVNQLSCLLYGAGISLPVGMELIKKDKWITDKKTGKQKRVASTDKQTLSGQMVSSACQHLSGVDYLLADTWRRSLEQVDFPLLLTKAVYHNKDGSQGVLYGDKKKVMLLPSIRWVAALSI